MSSPASPTQSQNASSHTPTGSAEWPFEHFPPPPPDGNWIPISGPPPPPKFPLPLPDVPSVLTLNPPIMALTFPPPSPLVQDDPTWLNQMVADLTRQRAHLDMCFTEGHTDVSNAYVEAGLADAELEDERALVRFFLNAVAGVTGDGFVRRMLVDVQDSVEAMSRPEEYSDASSSASPSGSNGAGHDSPV